MIIEIPVVVAKEWSSKPLFDYFEEIKSYLIIIKGKRDYRRLKLLMKVAKKEIVRQILNKSGVEPTVVFKIKKYGKEA